MGDSEKDHMSIVICGHVDSGKSTTTGRLLFELGGIPEREMEKLKAEAERLGKSSFAFAFYMDRQKEERERGVTISCTTKEFFTEKWHYTIIDAPGHRDFIKNMISGAAQADVALVMVPADGNFVTAIQRGNHKAGEIQGQTRQHSRLINLLGVKQLIIGVNKMDCDTAGYKKDRYDEISAEMINMLQKVGWKKDFVLKSTPVLPISGWVGDNLLKKSTNMAWWSGCDIEVEAKSGVEKLHIDCLYDCLNNMARPPVRPADSAMRLPVSGIYKIKGVGDVVARAGRILTLVVHLHREDLAAARVRGRVRREEADLLTRLHRALLHTPGNDITDTLDLVDTRHRQAHGRVARAHRRAGHVVQAVVEAVDV
jgi:elongation factor 1-alpha